MESKLITKFITNKFKVTGGREHGMLFFLCVFYLHMQS
jgi:hypothetical protein